MTPVLPGVYHIDLPWTNVWLLTRDGDAVVIDTGTCRDRRRMLAMIQAAVPSGIKLHSVLLTHAHIDHAGNSGFLADKFSAAIHAHPLEEPHLASGASYARPGLAGFGPSGLVFRLGDLIYPVKRCPIAVRVQEGDSIETPIGALTVVHTPGHTAGHVAYYCTTEGWLFSGDALLTVIPWLRRGGLSLAPRVFSQDYAAAVDSAHRIAALEPDALLAGHGRPLLTNTCAKIRRFAERLPG